MRPGDAAEGMARDELAAYGYCVAIAPREATLLPNDAGALVYRAAGGDYFTLFDLVALGPDGTRWIQVKSTARRHPPEAEWCEGVALLAHPPATWFEWWWRSGTHWLIWRYGPDDQYQELTWHPADGAAMHLVGHGAPDVPWRFASWVAAKKAHAALARSTRRRVRTVGGVSG